MNCPGCGLQTLPDQKYCRSCGTGLRMTTQGLDESMVKSNPDRVSVASRNDEKLRTSRWMLWGFIVMFVGVAVGVVGKKLLHDDIVTTIGILISLAGIFATVYPHLSPPRRRKLDANATAKPEPLIQSTPVKVLAESQTQYTPSVTERTTNLLEVPARRSEED